MRLGIPLCFALFACGSSPLSGSPPPGGTTEDAGSTPGSDGGAPGDPVVDPFADAGPPVEPGDPGPADVTFEVRSDRDVHAIAKEIYGINGTTDIAQNKQTVVRLGGNRWTAYNWENNASNAGSDYLFQNDGYLSSSNTPGQAVKTSLDTARTGGAALIATVPIVDYVSADKNGGGDVRNSGANYLQTRFRQNRPTKGSALSLTPDASDGFVYQDEFVSWLKTNAGGANVFFSLDNEPDLWSETHAEVHAAHVGYDELCTRSVSYAKGIKGVWAEAKVLGFVSYGWYGYVTLQDAPDRAQKGEFIDYFLGKMKEAETANGKRLVDYLDLHWYPEAQGGGQRITTASTNAAIAAARVAAPRSLWDASYKETSWIADAVGNIRLIPRIKEKIAARYPGTKLAFTEWNYGGGGDVSAAVASADVLGIFGRDGVDLATFWPLAQDESFAYAAFKAFRNFDGNGAAFGDTSIHATTSDVASSSVYAAVDAANGNRLVLVAINKSTAPKTAAIKLAHPARFASAKTYAITSTAPRPVAGMSLTPAATNAFRYTMPAMSVTVIVPTS
jgi:hypothetical protein